MASTHTLTGNIYDLAGATLGASGLRVVVVTNLPAKDAVIDKTTNGIHLGGKVATLNTATGEFSVDLIDTSATDLNVAANTLQYEVRAEYVNGGTRGRDSWVSGWFALTADANLADLATDASPLAVASASGYALEAKAYRDEAEAISGLTGEDAAIANRINTPGSQTQTALSATYARVFTPEKYGAAGDGTVTDDAAEINAAAAAAKAAGGMLYAEGTYRINSTVTIECDADLSRATFNYYGTGLAVLIGSAVSAEVLYSKTISTPTIMFANKPTTGWTAGTVGLRVNNANTCRITTAEVRGFETGLLAYGLDQGTVHCDFFLGTLRNNKRNLYFDATVGTGWVNDNSFYNGRYMHSPAEGTAVTGVRQIAFSTNYDFNNNVFYKPSVEGDVAENMIEVGRGYNNVFISPRFEGAAPKVVWGLSTSTASQNMIIGGYQTDLVTFTSNAASSTRVNQVVFPGINRFQSESIKPGGAFRGAAAATNPALEVYDYDDASWTTWRFQFTQQFFKARAGTAFDTARLDPASGRWLFGGGASAPTMFIGNIAGTMLGMNAPLGFSTDNTHDIGSSGLRPRHVIAGTSLQVAGVQHIAGTGSPEGVKTAPQGSLYTRTDGGAGTTLYVKESGAGNTGWVAK